MRYALSKVCGNVDESTHKNKFGEISVVGTRLLEIMAFPAFPRQCLLTCVCNAVGDGLLWSTGKELLTSEQSLKLL